MKSQTIPTFFLCQNPLFLQFTGNKRHHLSALQEKELFKLHYISTSSNDITDNEMNYVCAKKNIRKCSHQITFNEVNDLNIMSRFRLFFFILDLIRVFVKRILFGLHAMQ